MTEQPYSPGDASALLDVYFPSAAGTRERLPTIVWIHGGAWLSGSRTDASPYFELIASAGFTVASVDYALAPDSHYPTPIHQINQALAYLLRNADRLHVDPDRIVLAGDSAGAQIASQVATLITEQGYARRLALTASLLPRQLRGVVLFCGFYDMRTFIERGRLAPIAFLRWGVRTMVWAYTGSYAIDSDELHMMSTLAQVTAAFPPAFISGGNADPLTDLHSRPLADRLADLGVEVSALFYELDHRPALGHEYQFDLDGDDGQNALAQMLAFLKECTAT